MDLIVDLGLESSYLSDGVLASFVAPLLREIAVATLERNLYLKYYFTVDHVGFGIGIKHDLTGAI
jgi:hypothetical protein